MASIRRMPAMPATTMTRTVSTTVPNITPAATRRTPTATMMAPRMALKWRAVLIPSMAGIARAMSAAAVGRNSCETKLAVMTPRTGVER